MFDASRSDRGYNKHIAYQKLFSHLQRVEKSYRCVQCRLKKVFRLIIVWVASGT